MVQRFVSSMRPTIYASAVSCRHIIAHPWKCISYLPTCRAISWTSHKKGSFWIRSSVLFWNCHISQRETIPGQYLLDFFTWPAHKNSFQGGFASHGRLELLMSRLLPTWLRWPSLCSHLGQLLGGQWWRWPPHLLQLLHLLNPLQYLLCLRGSLSSWRWGLTGKGAFFLFPLTSPPSSFSVSGSHHLSPPSLVLLLSLPYWNLDKES